jgi:hypothetical protein
MRTCSESLLNFGEEVQSVNDGGETKVRNEKISSIISMCGTASVHRFMSFLL